MYGCSGSIEDSRGRPALHYAPAAHDDDLVADLPNHGEVVRDEEVGHAGLLADVGEQVEHLRLDGDVERGHRLV